MSSNWSKFNLAKHYQMIVLPEGTGERCRGIYNQYLSSCCRAISAPVLPWMELLCCYLRPALVSWGSAQSLAGGDSQALLRGQARSRGQHGHWKNFSLERIVQPWSSCPGKS